MMYLNHIERKHNAWGGGGFPFDVPAIRQLRRLEFSAPVTFLVGDNGCGKSTILEAIAVGMNLTAVGAHDISRDPTLQDVASLADQLTFSRRRRPRAGFFLRAEDFFGFTQRMARLIAELRDEGGECARQASALAARYGQNPDARSHGENLLHVLNSRLAPGGLYLLDEPDTPLSPLSQIALLSLMQTMVGQDCQFIVATHSPILLAFPEATIFNVATQKTVLWHEFEHVKLTRDFLTNPDAFLRHL